MSFTRPAEFSTIEGFESLTKQQIADMAVKHIGSTGVKSVRVSVDPDIADQCVYSGSGCNAAVFLKEEHRAKMDDLHGGTGWQYLVRDGYVPTHECAFITELQSAHDSCSEGGHFKSDYDANMRKLYREYELDTTELDKLGWGE